MAGSAACFLLLGEEDHVADRFFKFPLAYFSGFGSQHSVHLHFIQPGKPLQNVYIKIFNGTFRDECFNEHVLLTLQEAQLVFESWQREYSEERTHNGSGI